MSDKEKFKTIDNNNILKNKNEIINKPNRNNHLFSKKKSKILNIEKILSKGNFSNSRNRNSNKKNFLIEDLFSQKLTNKSINENEPKSHKKNLTNIYDTYIDYHKPDINFDLVKLTDKKLFENKMHRRIQTERESIEIIKKINKNGNKHVLSNIRNLKNNVVNTEYLFTAKNNISRKKSNSIYHSTYLNLSTDKSFLKKKYMKKIYPSLIMDNDIKTKNNSNNYCLKSCNFENNQHFLKNKKIYPIKKKSKIIENIFKTQFKTRNNYKFYSHDNSISNIKSNKLNKKLDNFLKFPNRRIYLTSKIEKSFEFINNSNSNQNIKTYTKSFDDNIKNKIFNIGGKEIQKNYFSPVHKKTPNMGDEKPNKKNDSKLNLKKKFPFKIQNIEKENEI